MANMDTEKGFRAPTSKKADIALLQSTLMYEN